MNLIDNKQNEEVFINKFLTGEISDSELDFFKSWLEESPINRKKFDEENEIWQETNLQAMYEYFNTEKGWKNISKRLNISGNTNTDNKIITLRRSVYKRIIAAASIALMVAIGSVFYGTMKQKPVAIAVNSSITEIQTREGERANITLPDSTHVIINSGTTIKYSSDFNVNDRKIWLSGEAYFEVAKNSAKPFHVYLDKIKVVATGTKFNIFSYSSENRVETTLEEGSVQVEIPGKDIIYVTPGQQVVYFAKNNKALVKNVTTEGFTSWKENKLRLNDTPFEEALHNIARRYNVVFEIQDKKLLELKYTATFIDESIEDVMQMLKTVSPIKYKIINRTKISDKTYVKPKIIITSNKQIINN